LLRACLFFWYWKKALGSRNDFAALLGRMAIAAVVEALMDLAKGEEAVF